MTEAILLALGLLGGGDPKLLAMAGGAVWAPGPTSVAVAVAAVIGRRAERRVVEGIEIRFLETVVAELRAGASLRRALRTACGVIPEAGELVRKLDVGAPLRDCVDGVRARLPVVGDLVADAVAVGAGGGRMLPVFEELVVHAGAEAEVAAEVRTATAQIRASLWVLVGGPVVYLGWSLASGRLATLLALPGGTTIAMAGGALFLVGATAMVGLARSRRR